MTLSLSLSLSPCLSLPLGVGRQWRFDVGYRGRGGLMWRAIHDSYVHVHQLAYAEKLGGLIDSSIIEYDLLRRSEGFVREAKRGDRLG